MRLTQRFILIRHYDGQWHRTARSGRGRPCGKEAGFVQLLLAFPFLDTLAVTKFSLIFSSTPCLSCLRPHTIYFSLMDQVFANFTENAIATQAVICERTSCSKTIAPGDVRYYIRNAEDKENLPGKWVCEPCFHYYRMPGKGVTVRATSRQLPVQGHININSIRRDVNESQRQGTYYLEYYIQCRSARS